MCVYVCGVSVHVCKRVWCRREWRACMRCADRSACIHATRAIFPSVGSTRRVGWSGGREGGTSTAQHSAYIFVCMSRVGSPHPRAVSQMSFTHPVNTGPRALYSTYLAVCLQHRPLFLLFLGLIGVCLSAVHALHCTPFCGFRLTSTAPVRRFSLAGWLYRPTDWQMAVAQRERSEERAMDDNPLGRKCGI